MQMYYSAAKRGFFAAEIHGALPDDAQPVSDALYRSCQGKYVAPDADGMPVPYAAPPDSGQPHTPTPSTPVTAPAVLRDGIQAYMDSQARALGYDSIVTAITYADEPTVPKFQLEGQVFRAWRSLVWAACYAHLSLVEAGEAPLPTLQEAIAMLPPLEMPA